jgi:hypothetical protein
MSQFTLEFVGEAVDGKGKEEKGREKREMCKGERGREEGREKLNQESRK